MLSIVKTKMQEQGLTGNSSVRLTSRASHRLGKCRLSWVWLSFWLLSALSECSAWSGRGSYRHASSGFVSVQTDPTAQSWHDLVRTSVFLFTLIVLFSEEFLGSCCFSEEFLLHSSSWFYRGVSLTLLELVLVKSFSYTPRAGFSEEFLLHSSSWFYWGVSRVMPFYWGVSLTLLVLVLLRSFSYTPRDGVSEEFLLYSSSWC